MASSTGWASPGDGFDGHGGVVPYEIHSGLTNQARVTSAITHWQQRTHIRFVRRTSANASRYPELRPVHSRHRLLVAGRHAGRAPRHRAGRRLRTGCDHPRDRPCRRAVARAEPEDRNTFIRINFQPTSRPGREHNFNQHITDGDDYGRYDFGSIMHYGATAFSRNGRPTIVPLRPGVTIGQRSGAQCGRRGCCPRHVPEPGAVAIVVGRAVPRSGERWADAMLVHAQLARPLARRLDGRAHCTAARCGSTDRVDGPGSPAVGGSSGYGAVDRVLHLHQDLTPTQSVEARFHVAGRRDDQRQPPTRLRPSTPDRCQLHLLLEVDRDVNPDDDGADGTVSSDAVPAEAVDAGPPPATCWHWPTIPTPKTKRRPKGPRGRDRAPAPGDRTDAIAADAGAGERHTFASSGATPSSGRRSTTRSAASSSYRVSHANLKSPSPGSMIQRPTRRHCATNLFGFSTAPKSSMSYIRVVLDLSPSVGSPLPSG